MGLDNIPKNYPCKKRGTAVIVTSKDDEGNIVNKTDGTPMTSIDCIATQECGGCPYKEAYAKSGLTSGPTYGMFGTDCWYRGKYGNYMIAEAGYDTREHNFYGDEDGEVKSPEGCVEMADFIRSILDEDKDEDGKILDGQGQYAYDMVDDLIYAEWYLRWAAEECDGLIAW